MSLGVLSAIGNTPLVQLHQLIPDARFRLFAKLEALNPGGSIKDRPALRILQSALESGRIGKGSVIVESSSGNMGIGLAQVCRYLGLRFICVVDSKTVGQNVRILEAYGAKVVKVTEPVDGELLKARLKRVEELLAEHPGSFWPNQYENRGNPGAHHASTMREIANALGRVDYLFVATSTCGTIRGCGEYCVEHGLPTCIVAVDAKGSRIFGDPPAERSIPGLGAGIEPPHLDRSLVHEIVHVSDLDCVRGCRRLVEREAIFAGGSSGALVSAVERWRERIPEGATVVVILPDRGERYLDTVYDDAWVRSHCGEWTDDDDGPPANEPAAATAGAAA